MIRRFSLLFTTVFMATIATHADDALIAKGRQTFLNHCARCHGNEGKGDGYDAKRLPVVPRNLTEGIFKFQSTVQGTPPSDEDILWTLNHGMAGAGMPSFASLSSDAKHSLVAYVKTLSPIFKEGTPEPLKEPSLKARVNLEKGKELFTKLQCALCHGDGGRANGTSAFTLKDKWERPIPVANLAQGWRYRAGDSATQIYYRLMAGINGAPMPSYAEAVSSEDAWQLAKYIESMQIKPNFKPEIIVKEISTDLPIMSDDAVWATAPHTEVNVQGSLYRNGKKEHTSIHAISVRAVRNEKGLAFQLSWDDPTADTKNPPDAFLMAIKPKNFKGKGTQNLHNLYYPGAEPLDLYQWSAQDPSSVRQGVGSLDELVRPGARSSNSLSAQSAYSDGVYTMVFQRPWKLAPGDELSPSDTHVMVGFGAWNGGNNESGLNRAVSQWISLILTEPKSHH
jgi:DMSO reductase family type II enzyme heme b subunit